MIQDKAIKKIVLTWKSQQQRNNNNVYTFYVNPLLNKFQLRELIEKNFDVKIEKIHSLREKPVVRNARKNLYTKLRKKVFVKLKPGYKIGEENEQSTSYNNPQLVLNKE